MSEVFPNPSRIHYIESTIESVCTLLDGNTPEEDKVIVGRGHALLKKVWDFETQKPRYFQEVKAIWDKVHTDLESQERVTTFRATFDRTLNVSADAVNVIVQVQPLRRASLISFALGPNMNWKASYVSYDVSWQI